jgi:hypothetical protein
LQHQVEIPNWWAAQMADFANVTKPVSNKSL